MFRIKICGITTPDDARLAAKAGADAIGINFYARSPRFVELDVAKKIGAVVPAMVAKVGVFVNATVEEIRETATSVPLNYVQLHGDEPPEMLNSLADLAVIKAFRCRDNGLEDVASYINKCSAMSQSPSAVLIDAYAPGEYGGTGQALDWAMVGADQSLPSNVPLILAGGLNADNVGEAIHLARPMGVDVASGVESSPGVKDAAAVQHFVANATAALADGG